MSSLIRWEPFDEFDRFFNDRLPSMMQQFPSVSWDLAVDLYEEGDVLIAEMQIPGMDKELIKVAIKDGHLRVSGVREEKKEEKKKNYFHREMRRGSFERTIKLPVSVDKKKVKAEYKGGILKVMMPKADAKEDEVKVSVAE